MDIPIDTGLRLPHEGQTRDRVYAWKIARRAAPPVVAGMALGAVLAYGLASTQPKSYTAHAALAIDGAQIAIPELSGALRSDNPPDPMPWVRTEVQALTGRQLLMASIADMHLDRDPEFNPALRKPGWFDHVKAWLKSLVPHQKSTSSNDEDEIVQAVNHRLVISQDNRSLVIGIDFSARDPKIASGFVDTLIHNYVAKRAADREAVNLGANADLAHRVEQVRQQIAAIEQRMRDLRSSTQVVGLRAGSVGQQQLEDLATAAAHATLERMQLEATLARANSLAAQGNPGELASVLGSETISRLRDREAVAAGRAADLSARFGSAYPEVRSAEADLSATRRELSGEVQRILASLQTQLRVARAHERDVQQQLDAARASSVKAQNVEAEIDQLKQDAATQRSLYRTLLDREQQTVAQPPAARTPDIRILSLATPPEHPSAPNMKLAAGFGALAGGLLGFAGWISAQSVKDPIDPARFAAATGADPLLTVRRRRSGLASRVIEEPRGEEAEALRLFRSRLRAAPRARAARVLGFVGGRDVRYASDAALAFARTAALDGRHVLFVDFGPGQGSAPPALPDEPEGDWREGLWSDALPSLARLGGGARSAETLEGQEIALENLLAEAREEYELIVLTGQAGEAGSALASRSDVPVLVVDPGLPSRDAEPVARTLRSARGALAALILTT